MNICNHYNCIKTKTFLEFSINVFANMCSRSLQLNVILNLKSLVVGLLMDSFSIRHNSRIDLELLDYKKLKFSRQSKTSGFIFDTFC